MADFEPHPTRRGAVVTGASSGIGRAAAVQLGAAGFPVVLGARRADRCEEAAAEIRADADPAAFAAQLTLNLLGPQQLVHHLGPGMVERRRGDIVFVTSDVAEQVRPFMAGYVAAKNGLEGLAKAMRLEMEGTGVRVGMVRPGPAMTEQGSTWSGETIGHILSEWTRHGLIRHGGYLTADHVAAAIVAMVTVPRGAAFTVIEVQPEAPLT